MKELEDATGLPARQIRYLISLDLVPRPDGAGRWADYDQTHVDAIHRWQSLRTDGHKASSMTKAFSAIPVSLEPMKGVTVMLAPSVLPPDFDAAAMSKAIAKILPRFLILDKEIDNERD